MIATSLRIIDEVQRLHHKLRRELHADTHGLHPSMHGRAGVCAGAGVGVGIDRLAAHNQARLGQQTRQECGFDSPGGQCFAPSFFSFFLSFFLSCLIVTVTGLRRVLVARHPPLYSSMLPSFLPSFLPSSPTELPTYSNTYLPTFSRS